MAKLTASQIRNLKVGRHGDGGGLHLRVSRGGSKQFILRKVVRGVRRDIPIGNWPTITLAQARMKGTELHRAIFNGENPLKAKEATPTFAEAAQKTFEALSPRWRNAKVAANWMQRLGCHAMKHLADLPVDEITREDILRVLTPIWTAKPETARKVRRSIKATLGWCQAHGFIQHNSAGEMIDGALPSMPSVKQNYRALPFAEVGAALEIIRASRASMSAGACLEFTILTAARSGEARNAEWAEINLESREWRIPASRTKNGREHRQPLSDETIKVLEQVRPLSGGNGLVFPSPVKKSSPLSDMSLTKILRDTGLSEKCVVHGFRTSFRVWASENTSADFAVMELCLGHTVGSAVVRAYARSDLFEKRVRLMASWGRFIAGAERGKVVQVYFS